MSDAMIEFEGSTAIPMVETADAARALCGRLLETTAELIGVLDRETALLRKAKPQEIVPLQARKTALGNALSRDLAAFKTNVEFIRTAASDEVNTLKEQNEAFRKSLQINEETLRAITNISEQLIRTISHKVAEKRGGPSVYGANAAMSSKTASTNPAISVDRSL